MTKEQMMALKPGDIIVDKNTGDQFKFVKLTEVPNIVPKNGGLDLAHIWQEIAVEQIPGFQYAKRYVTYGPYCYFSHKRMALKGAEKWKM